MDDLHGRNFDVEECAWQTRAVVCELYALFVLAKDPGREISLVRGGTELVR
jgi:hypothetical protein